MTLRKKAFTLIEMLVVIMIIAILAAALFPAITAAIAQAKSTAMKNKGRGVWTAVLSANAEREPLGMPQVWPGFGFTPATATDYFRYLMGWSLSGNTVSTPVGSAVCEDLKAPALVGSGMTPATDATSFSAANNGWCVAVNVASNVVSEDAFIFTRNIDFGAGKASGATVLNSDTSFIAPAASGTAPSGGFSLNRGIYVTYGGACIDRREKYLGVDQYDHPTNNLVSSTNGVVIYRP